MTPFLEHDLVVDEGLCLHAYQDTVGIWTVGVGHAHVLPGTVWSQAQAMAQLGVDIACAAVDLDRALPWWRGLNDARQDVLANMTFNMGIGRRTAAGRPGAGVLGFPNTLQAIERGAYAAAADGMLQSKWARQTGKRARRLAEQMRTGVRIAAT